jgi:hypothetical protein
MFGWVEGNDVISFARVPLKVWSKYAVTIVLEIEDAIVDVRGVFW